jgi:hypothetical protein
VLALGQDADDRAVKGPVDAAQQNQQKARNHIGKIKRAKDRAGAKGSGDRLLAKQTKQLAQQRSNGDNSSDSSEGAGFGHRSAGIGILKAREAEEGG